MQHPGKSPSQLRPGKNGSPELRSQKSIPKISRQKNQKNAWNWIPLGSEPIFGGTEIVWVSNGSKADLVLDLPS